MLSLAVVDAVFSSMVFEGKSVTDKIDFSLVTVFLSTADWTLTSVISLYFTTPDGVCVRVHCVDVDVVVDVCVKVVELRSIFSDTNAFDSGVLSVFDVAVDLDDALVAVAVVVADFASKDEPGADSGFAALVVTNDADSESKDET